MIKVPLFNKAIGLNTVEDPTRVMYDAETGVLGLTRADNATVELSGAIKRRDGYTKLASGLCHSLFSCGLYGYCVKDGIIQYIDKDLTLTPVTPIATVGNFKVSYVLSFDGTDDKVFYSNGVQVGVLKGLLSTPWTIESYVGVDSTRTQVVKFMPGIPAGHLLEIFNGCMYIAKHNMLYISEPYAFSWFDEKAAFFFDKRITMLRAVLDGIYIATDSEIFFLSGTSPSTFAFAKAFNSGVVEGTDKLVPATVVGLETASNVIVFATNAGLCLATQSGIVLNFTSKFIDFPASSIGASLLDSHNKYTVTIS